jgi:hypothetical protein
MPRVLDPFQFVLIAVGGWMNQRQLQMIDYLREENRVLREQLRGRRVRLNDDQRRRLATRAKGLGRKLLAEVTRPERWADEPFYAIREVTYFFFLLIHGQMTREKTKIPSTRYRTNLVTASARSASFMP